MASNVINAPVSDGKPLPGYYKMRVAKEGAFLPVAIWSHEGQLVARVGAEMRDPHEIWLWAAKNKVSREEANYAFEHGRWPGDAPLPLDHNNAPSDDPFELFQREIEAEEARVRAWVAEPHEGKIEADRASNWLAALRKTEQRVKDAFDAEKAPVLAESQRIDGKWRDLKRKAAEIKKLMDDCYQDIGRRERKRMQEIADRKAREEAEALRKEREAEHAKQAELARLHNVPIEMPEPELPLTEVKAAPVRVAFGGAQGNRIGLRKVPPKAVVEDWAKAAAFYSGHDSLRAAIQKLADHDARDNRHDVPGVKFVPGE